jgi:hypothetical protein
MLSPSNQGSQMTYFVDFWLLYGAWQLGTVDSSTDDFLLKEFKFILVDNPDFSESVQLGHYYLSLSLSISLSLSLSLGK